MSVSETFPAGYREAEARAILAALRAGECVQLLGLSGAGKSNLARYLATRSEEAPAFALVDGNRARPRSVAGLFRLACQVLGEQPLAGEDELVALERALERRLAAASGGLCLLLDRFDALDEIERGQAAGPLRALRDAFKYRLTYLLAARRPVDPAGELAELFFANTIWLGPVSPPDARWSIAQYAARHGLEWDNAVAERIMALTWSYPSLLRAACEAYASGASLEVETLRAHPSIQRRVEEFWADNPTVEELRRSGLASPSGIQPLLAGAQPAVDAASPDLTGSEHRLLAYLQSRPGEVCEKDSIIQAVWPSERIIDGLRDDSLAQLIRRLRQKIEPDPSRPVHVLTVPGRGYRYLP